MLCRENCTHTGARSHTAALLEEAQVWGPQDQSLPVLNIPRPRPWNTSAGPQPGRGCNVAMEKARSWSLPKGQVAGEVSSLKPSSAACAADGNGNKG